MLEILVLRQGSCFVSRLIALMCPPLWAAMFVAPVFAQLSPFESRTYERGGLKITVGPSRMIMRGPMFPWGMLFDDGSILIIASAVEEGGPPAYVRSTDRGETWSPFKPPPGYSIPNVQLPDGTAINASAMPPPIPERPGYYQVGRYESKDRGLSATFASGMLYLPPDLCSPEKPHQFHGNTIVTSRGELLSVMQGMEQAIPDWPEGGKTPFKCYLVKSTDQGHTWNYVSHVASLRDLSGSTAAALKMGWRTWGPCESALAEVGDGRLVCVMRTLNDDLEPLIGEASNSYRDLFHTVRGADIYKGSLNLPGESFYTLSPPTTPLLICYSDDGGEHWTQPAAMREARGCMPQLAYDGEILALAAGALHYPRWGNGITFSLDGGKTWTDLINYAPFFTSGYGALLPIAPGRFLAIYDYAAPQPWKDHTAHWVGVAEVTVERN
jgi:hypothetical protein